MSSAGLPSTGRWDQVFDTNLKAPFFLLRVVAPPMIRRRQGHIIQIASLAGKNAFAGGGVLRIGAGSCWACPTCAAEEDLGPMESAPASSIQAAS